MSELANATRTPNFVFDRGTSTVGPSVLAASFGASPTAYVVADKGGQTRIVKGPASPSGVKIRAIGNDKNYNVGSAVASDDYSTSYYSEAMQGTAIVFIVGKGEGVGDAISAYDKKIEHKIYKGSGESGTKFVSYTPKGSTALFMPLPAFGIPIPTSPENASGEHSKFKWPGFAPFFKFNASGDRLADYNQPSTWIFLNKQPEDIGVGSGIERIGWQHGRERAELDMRLGEDGFYPGGMTVLSRGLVYYHRPGVWAEQPNFFNPFWRARLAPVGQKLQNFWDQYVSGSISTDSKDKRMQQLVALLKNAQMDMFTSAITALIAH
ncbi:MAG: hypothetical protein JRH20_05420 [Deltaproteobacteria bacterium]|nr:hypothetical protein [Deltaproteobacteria bacterium]